MRGGDGMIDEELASIRRMVLVGNHGHAIMALLDLFEVMPTQCLDAVEESLRDGRLRRTVMTIHEDWNVRP